MAIKLRNNLTFSQDISNQIHSPFIPTEVDITDNIECEIFDHEKRASRSVRPIQYSPFGVEFELDPKDNLIQGDNVFVKIKLGDISTEKSGIVVSSGHLISNFKATGIRFVLKNSDTKPGQEKRTAMRWTCSDEFLPTGTAPNPIKYNDFIIFRVENISSTGLSLITSMRNKLLCEGQRLDSTISLPLVGSIALSFIIVRIDYKKIDEKDYMVLGVKLLKPDTITSKVLAEYLLNFGSNISVQSLKEHGFNVTKISRWLDFTYVKTEEEYNQVLHLRYEAFKAANKLTENDTIELMADEFDARAKILLVKHQNKVVGTARIFTNDTYETSEVKKYLPDTSALPKANDCLECSRLCTDPNIRGADVMHELMAHFVLSALKLGKRYLIANAGGTLLDYYKRIGWQSTGIKFANRFAKNGYEAEIIKLDTYKTILGKGIGPIQWHKVYGNLFSYLENQELTEITSVDRLRLLIYKLISKIIGPLYS